jgi:5-methylcytosine-specific restriction endonuclease McrA
MSYERTPEHRAKMSAALTGKPHSYRSASTRPEVARRIAAAWTPEKREAARQRGLAMAADRAWRDLIARSVTGALNPNHQGKGNTTGYGPGWGRRHKALIRERAGHQCESCGATGRLDIHHRDRTKTNHHPDNLVVLCRRCHKRDHPNR